MRTRGYRLTLALDAVLHAKLQALARHLHQNVASVARLLIAEALHARGITRETFPASETERPTHARRHRRRSDTSDESDE